MLVQALLESIVVRRFVTDCMDRRRCDQFPSPNMGTQSAGAST
jgi:hypothetical protein